MTTTSEPGAAGALGAPSDQPPPAPDRYPWIAMGVVLIGTFMVILDTTIVNVALPQIGAELHESSSIEWVATAYLLAVGISTPASGWLADRFGRKRVFVGCLALFSAGVAGQPRSLPTWSGWCCSGPSRARAAGR